MHVRDGCISVQLMRAPLTHFSGHACLPQDVASTGQDPGLLGVDVTVACWGRGPWPGTVAWDRGLGSPSARDPLLGVCWDLQPGSKSWPN